MKKLILFLFAISISITTAIGQEITGQWNGVLKVQGVQLRLVFHINKTEKGLSSTMDSPDQGVQGILTTTTAFENLILRITIKDVNIEYEGVLKNDKGIIGIFKQNGQAFPMDLIKGTTEKPNRPQEPQAPFPYYSEDITFENKKAGISLAGTLTLPKKEGIYPVVILISGSGQQDRNGEVFGHKPFFVLADYLTRNGIAVLRYDDRGTAQSTGDFNSSTTFDFATDVESAIDYLKTRSEINKNKIGLIGHSEGGLIAPIVASKSKDVTFIVLLAAPGISGDEITLIQQKIIGRASGIDEVTLAKNEKLNRGIFEIIKKSNNTMQLKVDLIEYMKQNDVPEDKIILSIIQTTSPWMINFIRYDPSTALEKVRCPVLALNGNKDVQVLPEENLDAIKNSLIRGGNKKFTILELPNINHFFQECTTGLPYEYPIIEQTFSPYALEEITKWVQKQTK